MAKDKGGGKAGKGKAGKVDKGAAGKKGKVKRQKLPKGQRPGLVDRLTVLVGVAFAGSLAWQYLPL